MADRADGGAAPRPWDADRILTPRQALEAVRSQFPRLNATSIEPLGSGWENDVFLVDQSIVFRFPRRAAVAERVDWEIGIARVIGRALVDLGIAVPDVRWRGTPGPHFPYRYTGYPYITGDPSDHPGDEAAARGLAEAIAAMLVRIHGISAADLQGIEVGDDNETDAEIVEEAKGAVPHLLRSEPDDIRACAEWLLRKPDVPPPSAGKPVFLYNDLCPDHALVVPGTTRLSGLIDFTDASWGDPVLDFVMLPGWLGWSATEAALRRTGHDQDAAFRERLRCRARAKNLYWLLHAHLRGGDVEKHRSWVRRAFDLSSGAGHVRT